MLSNLPANLNTLYLSLQTHNLLLCRGWLSSAHARRFTRKVSHPVLYNGPNACFFLDEMISSLRRFGQFCFSVCRKSTIPFDTGSIHLAPRYGDAIIGRYVGRYYHHALRITPVFLLPMWVPTNLLCPVICTNSYLLQPMIHGSKNTALGTHLTILPL